MNSQFRKTVHILLVEDSPTDTMLTIKALKQARSDIKISHVSDGIEAIEFLKGQGSYKTAQKPDLILLDLNLPRKNGQEVLEELKTDPVLRVIPIVVLTTSHDQRDILQSYRLYANGFVSKPVGFDSFNEVINQIEKFWLSAATLP